MTELNSIGTGLLYSTYLGGNGGENGWGIAVDSSGNAYVAGFTDSSDFPTTADAFQTTFGGVIDVFVTQLNPTGLAFSTPLTSAAVLPSGAAVTSSSGYRDGHLQQRLHCGSDNFERLSHDRRGLSDDLEF